VAGAPRRDPHDRARVLDRRPFFIDRVYVLLIFAGIWALMQGVTDIVCAFQIRKLGELV
jgi:hypothetical protein